MHIADGVLPAWLSGVGWAITAAGVSVALRRLPEEELPRLSLVTAAIFLGGLIHLPLGPTSVHLLLNGLAGLLLGPLAFLSLFIALALQALLFQFGGLFSLGINTLIMGGPAFLVGLLTHRGGLHRNTILAGALCGGAVLLSGVMLALALAFAGENFLMVARLALAAHLPVAILEGGICVLTLKALKSLNPSLLPNRHRRVSLAHNEKQTSTSFHKKVFLLLLFLPVLASAHRLDLDVFLEGDTIRVEAFFPDGSPAVGDQVKIFHQGKLLATCTTDSQGVCTLPRPNYPEVEIVLIGKLGHRVARTLELSPPASPAQETSPSTPSRDQVHKGKFPATEILAGLGFIFGLSGFILAWNTRRRLKSLASTGD